MRRSYPPRGVPLSLRGRTWLWGPTAITLPSEERLTFVGDEELEIKMRVPRAAVKSIIGRKGATIKKVSDVGGSQG